MFVQFVLCVLDTEIDRPVSPGNSIVLEYKVVILAVFKKCQQRIRFPKRSVHLDMSTVAVQVVQNQQF